MAYAHGDWEFDLFDKARRFIRDAVIDDPTMPDAKIREAKEMCELFSYLLEGMEDDYFEFEFPEK